MIALLFGLMGCQSDVHPAPIVGSSYRIDDEVRDPESELLLDIFTTGDECAAAKINEVDVCRPMVDRARGEVHLSFMVRERETNSPFYIPLSSEQVLVSHNRARQDRKTLIPHNPRQSGQLYVLLIDGSGSMYAENGQRIKKVKRALLSKDVVDAFFPSDQGKTGVILVRFNDQIRGLDGGEPRIIRRKEEYKRVVETHILDENQGYTHLYKAVREGMTTLLRNKKVRQFVSTYSAQPTLIALTDGFNNEAASDTCGTNVPRLQETLEVVRKARSKGSAAAPVLYTVGLGERYRPELMPEGRVRRVTPQALCGDFVDARIDGNLENVGIDHLSLSWLAKSGGGRAFVKRNYRGLADVFLTAAAKRYEWFELKYRVPDPIFHRQSFDVRLTLDRGARSISEVALHPNPWFDGPPATADAGDDTWGHITSIRHTLTVLMPALGLLVFMNFLGAAWFNAYRRVLRRAKPRVRKR